jgi:hypothetical protein
MLGRCCAFTANGVKKPRKRTMTLFMPDILKTNNNKLTALISRPNFLTLQNEIE